MQYRYVLLPIEFENPKRTCHDYLASWFSIKKWQFLESASGCFNRYDVYIYNGDFIIQKEVKKNFLDR